MKSPVPIQQAIWIVGVCLALSLIAGCTQINQYTSKDLTLLPCENKVNDFFSPLEFDKDGTPVYADQAPAIENALHHAKRVYVFVHGWNKTPELAEGDYQDLICRFYTHSKRDETNAKRSIVIGVFWPSADFPPLLNFWRMKSRADDLAVTGFQGLIRLLANPSIESGGHYDLVFIGHSFGGRIILKGISHYIAELTPEKYRFLSSLNQLQLVLITTAMGEYLLMPLPGINSTANPPAFWSEWDAESFYREMVKQYGREFTRKELLVDIPLLRLQWHPTLVELSGLTDFRIYNVFSSHDDANKFLYPIGSFIERGGSKCAIGGCGVSHWHNLGVATSAGSLEPGLDLAQSNLWNIDASKIISSHTDIYKGRIANLVWELIAVPPPQYAEIAMPTYGFSSFDLLYGRINLHEDMARFNQRAMITMNRFRQMGDTRLTAVKELSVLAFDLDNDLRSGNWIAAENGIRKILEMENIYPGWFFHFGLGTVKKVLSFNLSSVRSEWHGLSKDSIQLLLSWILAKQGRCAEAAQVIEQLRMSSNVFKFQEKLELAELGADEVRLLNCH